MSIAQAHLSKYVFGDTVQQCRQEEQLLQTDSVTSAQLKSCRLLHNCTKSCILQAFETHSRSLEIITCRQQSVVTMLLSCTISDTMRLLQCTQLPVTLRSPSVSTLQLKLHVTYAFRNVVTSTPIVCERNRK